MLRILFPIVLGVMRHTIIAYNVPINSMDMVLVKKNIILSTNVRSIISIRLISVELVLKIVFQLPMTNTVLNRIRYKIAKLIYQWMIFH